VDVLVSTSASTSAGGSPWWVVPAIAIVTLLLGSGGIVAWRRLNMDRKLGVAAQETHDEDAMAARWEKMIDVQTKNLVEPLRTRLGEVNDELATIEVEQRALREEMALTRTKYWRAIQYIRTLCTWIKARSLGADHEPPPPPAEIAGDI